MTGAKIQHPPVHRITLTQFVILGVSGLLLRYQVDSVLAYSWVLGGLVAVVPQVYFAWRVFSQRGARAASQIARASYAGEIGKFVLAVAGFALIFALVRPVSGGAVFAGYGAMLIIQVAGSWMLLRHTGQP